MTEHPLRVLFLSRRNTARSLMAEALMNQTGRGRVAQWWVDRSRAGTGGGLT